MQPFNSHPGLFSVFWQPDSFSSKLVAERPFQAGTVICYLQGVTRDSRAYTSVQCGEDSDRDNIELNSDLSYSNHSCEPNTIVDVSSQDPKEWNFRALHDIRVGETLAWFYPSTEWKMIQPFNCECGGKSCLGYISGASQLSKEEITERGFVNQHILRLLERRDSAKDL